MKNWRPDNWTELRLKYAEQNMPVPEEASVALALLSAMEVGADAMLEALENKPAIRLDNKLETVEQYIIKTKDLPDGIWRILLIPEKG